MKLKLLNKLNLFMIINMILSVNIGSCFANTSDSMQPIKIQSSKAEFDDQKGIAIYTGEVIVDQGSRHLTSDTLTIYRDDANKIKLIVATGQPAIFHSQPNPEKPIGKGQANTIKFYPAEDKVDLIGNAKLTQDGDTIHGPLLSYYFDQGLLTAQSSNKQRTTVILKPRGS